MSSAETVFVPAYLEHQTYCFKHKKKLKVFHDELCGDNYIECPVCRDEMLEDMYKYFTGEK